MSTELAALLKAKIPSIVDGCEAVGRADAQQRYEIREKLLQDVNRHVDSLVAAVELRRPATFSEYTAWAASSLDARGVAMADLIASYEALRGALHELAQDDVSSYANVLDEALATLRSGISTKPESRPPSRDEAAMLADQYLELLLEGRRSEAVELVTSALDRGFPLDELYLRVLQPVMREVGRLWQFNKINVAQEHYVSAATQVLVSRLYPRLLDGPRNGYSLVAGAVGSNLHEIGLRFLCDIFELNGWDTHFVGANTPHRDFVSIVRKWMPSVIAVGATLAPQIVEVGKVIDLLRHDTKLGKIPIIVGGMAFVGHEDLWKEIGADGFAPDAKTAIATAKRLADRN